MFTVKTKELNTTILRELERVMVIESGSPDWDFAFGLARKSGINTPDYIDHLPAIYADPNMDLLALEEFVDCIPAENRKESDCVGILLSFKQSENDPADRIISCYEFIYKGQTVEILNSHGNVVSSIS